MLTAELLHNIHVVGNIRTYTVLSLYLEIGPLRSASKEDISLQLLRPFHNTLYLQGVVVLPAERGTRPELVSYTEPCV